MLGDTGLGDLGVSEHTGGDLGGGEGWDLVDGECPGGDLPGIEGRNVGGGESTTGRNQTVCIVGNLGGRARGDGIIRIELVSQ